MQILGAGNAEDLLDDVGNFPEHWTEDDRRHAVGGNAGIPARSNHERGFLCVPKTLSRVDDVTESPNLAR